MSTPPSNHPISNAEKLKNLADVGLHLTQDSKLQDLFGGAKKNSGPRDATAFTDKELLQLREWCAAGCAQYGDGGLDNAGVFEKLEVFMPNHSAETLRKKWEEVKGLPRLLPDVWNTPFPGLKRGSGGKRVAVGDDGVEKKKQEEEENHEQEEHKEDK